MYMRFFQKMDSSEAYWNCSTSNAFSFDDDEEDGARSSHFVFDDAVTPVDIPHTESSTTNIHDLISDEDLKLILEEQSLESYIVPKGITAEDELKLLRRRLQYVLHVPSIKFTLHKLLLGKTCLLEAYKSLEDKENLLKNLIETRNGDGILAVLIFLSRTLNERQFNRILFDHQDACDIYVHYLIETKYSKAIELLTMLGRSDDASMLQMKTEIAKNNKSRMRQLLNEYTNSPGVISIYLQILNNAISLNELLESSGKDDLSPVEVLYMACSKHSWKDQNLSDPWSPFKLVNEHQISRLQFEWVALNERVKAKSFADLETSEFFLKQSYVIRGKSFQTSFSLEVAIHRLFEMGAPESVLHLFLSKVTDPKKKLELAKHVKCTKSIMDALISLNNMFELKKFFNSLSEQSEHFNYCKIAFNDAISKTNYKI